jgi:hypothetical protein
VIALGWTLRGARGPTGLKTVDLPSCGIVVADEASCPTPRDRIRMQIVCAGLLPAFLPLSPNTAMRIEDALDVVRARGGAIAARLQELTGFVQVSLRADWGAPRMAGQIGDATGGTGRDWLAQRADLWRQDADRRSRVTDGLRAVLAARSPRPLAEHPGPHSVRLDALVDTADERCLEALAGDIGRRPDLEDTRIVLTGPWPVLSFARLTEGARG